MNVRTSGTLSREDLLTLSKSRTHEQETTADTFANEHMDMGVGGFPDLGGAEPGLALEGDKSLGVTKWQLIILNLATDSSSMQVHVYLSHPQIR